MPRFLEHGPGLVIFDCDGVLVDSETPMHSVLSEDLRERGLELTMEQCLAAFMGKSIEGVIEAVKLMGADLPTDWRNILYEKVHARLTQGVDLVEGVVPLIEMLSAENIPFCVASNGSEKKIELMLSQHGLWDVFKGRCYSAHTLGISKPNPALLGTAIAGMGGHRDHAVVIEDSPIGVLSAVNAGVPCLIYDAYRHEQLEHLPQQIRFARMEKIACRIQGLLAEEGVS